MERARDDPRAQTVVWACSPFRLTNPPVFRIQSIQEAVSVVSLFKVHTNTSFSCIESKPWGTVQSSSIKVSHCGVVFSFLYSWSRQVLHQAFSPPMFGSCSTFPARHTNCSIVGRSVQKARSAWRHMVMSWFSRACLFRFRVCFISLSFSQISGSSSPRSPFSLHHYNDKDYRCDTRNDANYHSNDCFSMLPGNIG